MRARNLRYKYQALRQPPRPITTANYPTGFDHDVKIPAWEEGEGGVVLDNCMGSKEGELSQLAVGDNADVEQALYYDDYSNILVTGCNRTGSSVNRTTSICEFLLDVGLSKSRLPRDLSEMRGYLCGRLGL